MKKVFTSSLVIVLLGVVLAYLQGARTSSFATASLAFSSSSDAQDTPYYTESSSGDRKYPDLLDATISELHAGLSAGHFTSVDLVTAYLARIDEVDVHGPALRSVIETSPAALAEAAKLDLERAQGKLRGPLHGVPILIKDNVDTHPELGLNTTAGSFALYKSKPRKDSPSVEGLRKAGAVVLGKANMSVWAQARGLLNQVQGWSPRGGQGTSAYWKGGNPCSSSSGSAVAVAAGLAAASVGSQTSGSIVCPADWNNIVGFKPTWGLISRSGMIPISHTQDSAGPFGRTVQDVAIMLTAMATHGRDEGDNATWTQPRHVQKRIDYAAAKHFHTELEKPLKGMRLGYSGERFFANQTIQRFDASVASAYSHSITVLKELGAEMVEVTMDCIGDDFSSPTETPFFNASDDTQMTMWKTEMRAGLQDYIATLADVPSAVYDLGGIIYFALAHPELEFPSAEHSDQGFLIEALKTRPNSTIDEYREHGFRLSREQGIEGALKKYKVSAIVSPSGGEHPIYPIADRAQFPIISVPMGFYAEDTKVGETFPHYPYPRAPAGISFTAGKWTEPLLLQVAHAYEQSTQVRAQRKPYDEAIAKSQIKSIVGPEV